MDEIFGQTDEKIGTIVAARFVIVDNGFIYVSLDCKLICRMVLCHTEIGSATGK
jgi:hypothetical protein